MAPHQRLIAFRSRRIFGALDLFHRACVFSTSRGTGVVASPTNSMWQAAATALRTDLLHSESMPRMGAHQRRDLDHGGSVTTTAAGARTGSAIASPSPASPTVACSHRIVARRHLDHHHPHPQRNGRASRQTMPIWNRMPLTLHQPCARTVGPVLSGHWCCVSEKPFTVLETAFCRDDMRWAARRASQPHTEPSQYSDQR